MSGDEARSPGSRRVITVTIAGKQYGIVSSADEKWLQGVATGVDEAMALVRDRTETWDSLDVAVLTALNLARELVLLREQVAANAAPAAAVGSREPEALLDAERIAALIELAEGAVDTEPRA